MDREADPEEQGAKQKNQNQCKHGVIDPLVVCLRVNDQMPENVTF